MESRIYKRLNTDFNNIKLHILENGLFHGDKNWAYNDVVSTFNRMYIMISGEACIENENGRYLMKPGKIYLIPNGSKNNYQCQSEMNKFYLHFQIGMLPGIDLFQGLENVLAIDYSEGMLDEILSFAEEGTVVGLLSLKSIFMKICAEFYAEAIMKYNLAEKQRGYYLQAKVMNYVAQHITSRLRISDMAEHFQMPYYQLTREFKKDTGIGLKEYMEMQLLMQAKERLLNTNLTISQIAEQLEFCDAYYFSRFFRKYERVSPKEYRSSRCTFLISP